MRRARSPSLLPGPDQSRPLLAATPCSRCATAIPQAETARSGQSRETAVSADGRSSATRPHRAERRDSDSRRRCRARRHTSISRDPGSVLRSCGHPSTTSYGPDTSCAPMAFGTAANAALGAAAGAESGGPNRPPSGMPSARPTMSAPPASPFCPCHPPRRTILRRAERARD
jgi:hypothetical protein